MDLRGLKKATEKGLKVGDKLVGDRSHGPSRSPYAMSPFSVQEEDLVWEVLYVHSDTHVKCSITSLNDGRILSSNWGVYYNEDEGCWGLDGSDGTAYLYKTTQEASKAPVAFDSVILKKDKKEQILSAISQSNKDTHKKLFDTWGFSEIFEKGTAITMLFYGVPGTGKTLMAQAVADRLKLELRIIGTADIETSEPGGAERNIKDLFKTTKPDKQILLFDECDSLLSSREEVGTILAAQINCMLTEIEKFTGIIIFTTNRLGKLDPALERRIAAKIEFPFPDKEERLQIWGRMIPKKAPISKDVNFKKLAEFPIPGGNIKNAVLNAARSAAYAGKKEISMKDFQTACNKEIESISAFVAAYEQSVHTIQRGQAKRETNGISVDTKNEIEKFMEEKK